MWLASRVIVRAVEEQFLVRVRVAIAGGFPATLVGLCRTELRSTRSGPTLNGYERMRDLSYRVL